MGLGRRLFKILPLYRVTGEQRRGWIASLFPDSWGRPSVFMETHTSVHYSEHEYTGRYVPGGSACVTLTSLQNLLQDVMVCSAVVAKNKTVTVRMM